ncbi:hypothetical protein L5515_014477 [Caenorhabditis briggsae]|uniref:GH18 domain-containing protein n=1 Tax=Caenorhabditis briggsae TaxID=6238 RepID=A0AAE9E988_CAEBR|nr:hypothetical protein L5515_014477 [Caenorhabditis briggsae]
MRESRNQCYLKEFIVILIVCGILSLGLSVIIWTVYDNVVSPDVTNTTVEPLETTSITTTTMPTTTTKPLACQKRIIGFFNAFDAKEITAARVSKLTHAVFAKIPMDYNGELGIKTQETDEAFEKFKSTAKGVETDVKVMISICGKTSYREIAQKTEYTRIFVNSVASFLENHLIDGVDMNWERENYHNNINLLKELRIRLNGSQLISVTLPSPPNSGATFQVDEILKYADFVNVVSMGYYDTDRTRTGPISPLYSGFDGWKKLDVNATMKYFNKEVKISEKLNIVIPFFTRIWSNAIDVVEPGREMFRDAQNEFSQVPFSKMKEDGWTEHKTSWDKKSKSSYIYDSETKTFLTFENEESISWKLQFIREENLGGLWIRFMDMDDDENTLLNSVTKLC